jgi:Carbohydrate binding module (family 6)/Secretion system C-terminal sorting domain
MKKLLPLLFFPVICYGQGDQTIIKVPINAAGTTFQAILHLPNDYGTTTTAYPLLIFMHGLGEGGANPASIYTSSTAGGPAYFIAQGAFPASFVNPKDGKSYKYIVVSPQANPQGVEGSTTAQELDYVLTYLYAHYRVDQTRVYLTGLSDGGESVVEYIGGEMTNGGNFTMFKRTHSIAAIVPMSENASAALFQQEADSIVSENVGAWGFGSTDPQGQNTLQLAGYCNRIKPGSMITTSYSGGHCCWGQFYDPTFAQNGMSIYQWLLQYTTGAGAASPGVGTTPAATGLTIPGKIVAASYNASIGVMTQNTSDAGGGLNVGWIDKGDWMDYPVNVTAAGTYTVGFRVATPNSGASFQLRTSSGKALAAISVPNTGGWQEWQTVNATVRLAAGSQTLQLYSNSAAGWNINWMNFASNTQGAQSGNGLALGSDSALVESNSSGTPNNVVILYPNPAKSSFTVQVGNALSGAMTIQVVDVTGRICQVKALQKDQATTQVEMYAESLPSGTYFVRVQVGSWSEIKKLMKY